MTKNQSDNQGNPETMFSQQCELTAMDEEIQASEHALNELVDAYSEAKAKIHSYLAKHFDEAQGKTKKSAGMDVFILWAASRSPELAEAYKTYIELSKKATIHTAILESKGRRLSGIQTKIKLNDWRKQ